MSDEKKRREIPEDLIEQLLKNVSIPDDLTGKDGLLKQLTARLVGKVLQAEMDQHLGYEKGEPALARLALVAVSVRERRSKAATP